MIHDLWEFWDTDTWDDDTWGEVSPATADPGVLNLVGSYVSTINLVGRVEQ